MFTLNIPLCKYISFIYCCDFSIPNPFILPFQFNFQLHHKNLITQSVKTEKIFHNNNTSSLLYATEKKS